MGAATPERSATIGASNDNDVSAAMVPGRSQRAVERDPRPLERQMPFRRWGISLRKAPIVASLEREIRPRSIRLRSRARTPACAVLEQR